MNSLNNPISQDDLYNIIVQLSELQKEITDGYCTSYTITEDGKEPIYSKHSIAEKVHNIIDVLDRLIHEKKSTEDFYAAKIKEYDEKFEKLEKYLKAAEKYNNLSKDFEEK